MKNKVLTEKVIISDGASVRVKASTGLIFRRRWLQSTIVNPKDLVLLTKRHTRTRTRTRTRTNTNPNGTEANAAGRSVRACDARKSES